MQIPASAMGLRHHSLRARGRAAGPRHEVLAQAVAATALALLGGALLTGCSSGPSTKDQVCTSFDELGVQLVQGNGIIGNPLFHKATELGDLAGRYPAQNLNSNAEALKKIGGSDSTSGRQLIAATGQIAGLCGHPLSLGMFGS